MACATRNHRSHATCRCGSNRRGRPCCPRFISSITAAASSPSSGATPEDVQSGVRVGDKEYRSFPASGIGISGDSALRVAFFALLYDQPTSTRIDVFARDEAGNQVIVPLDYRVFPKQYKSRIEIDDRFLQRVVPAIASSPGSRFQPTTS